MNSKIVAGYQSCICWFLFRTVMLLGVLIAAAVPAFAQSLVCPPSLARWPEMPGQREDVSFYDSVNGQLKQYKYDERKDFYKESVVSIAFDARAKATPQNPAPVLKKVAITGDALGLEKVRIQLQFDRPVALHPRLSDQDIFAQGYIQVENGNLSAVKLATVKMGTPTTQKINQPAGNWLPNPDPYLHNYDNRYVDFDLDPRYIMPGPKPVTIRVCAGIFYSMGGIPNENTVPLTLPFRSDIAGAFDASLSHALQRSGGKTSVSVSASGVSNNLVTGLVSIQRSIQGAPSASVVLQPAATRSAAGYSQGWSGTGPYKLLGPVWCNIIENGKVVCGSDNDLGSDYAAPPGLQSDVVSLHPAEGEDAGMICAIKRDGSRWCWGVRQGDGAYHKPAKPSALNAGIAEFFSSEAGACATLVNGDLRCVDPNNGDRLITNVKAASTVFWQSGSSRLVCAIMRDRTVQCEPIVGEPPQIPAGTLVLAGSGGLSHYCVIKIADANQASGVVSCAGDNSSGQLGKQPNWDFVAKKSVNTPVNLNNGSANLVQIDRPGPTPSPLIASQIVSFVYATCALASDGVWCWGADDQGRRVKQPMLVQLPWRPIELGRMQIGGDIRFVAVDAWGRVAVFNPTTFQFLPGPQAPVRSMATLFVDSPDGDKATVVLSYKGEGLYRNSGPIPLTNQQNVSFTLSSMPNPSADVVLTPRIQANNSIVLKAAEPRICRVENEKIVLGEPGECKVTATVRDPVNPAIVLGSATQSIMVAPRYFVSLSNMWPGAPNERIQAPVSLGATLEDGTAIFWIASGLLQSGSRPVFTLASLDASVCTAALLNTRAIVSLKKTGVCTIEARSGGTSIPVVSYSIKQRQTVSAPTTVDGGVIGQLISLTATSSAGLPVVLSVNPSTAANCTIQAGSLKLTAAGLCQVLINQVGNENYLPYSGRKDIGVYVPLTLAGGALPAGQLPSPYRASIVSSGGTGTLRQYFLAPGQTQLPVGFAVNADGTVNWPAPYPGVLSFVAGVTDKAQVFPQTVTATYTIEIKPRPRPLGPNMDASEQLGPNCTVKRRLGDRLVSVSVVPNGDGFQPSLGLAGGRWINNFGAVAYSDDLTGWSLANCFNVAGDQIEMLTSVGPQNIWTDTYVGFSFRLKSSSDPNWRAGVYEYAIPNKVVRP